MKTYEEAIKEMAGTLHHLRSLKDGHIYDQMSIRLSGKASIVAFIYGKTEDEVEKDIMAAA